MTDKRKVRPYKGDHPICWNCDTDRHTPDECARADIVGGALLIRLQRGDYPVLPMLPPFLPEPDELDEIGGYEGHG